MPCGDCISVKAEVSALKSFISEWFNAFLTQMQSMDTKIQDSANQSMELRKEMLEQFETLRADLTERTEEKFGVSATQKDSGVHKAAESTNYATGTELLGFFEGNQERTASMPGASTSSLADVSEEFYTETSQNDGIWNEGQNGISVNFDEMDSDRKSGSILSAYMPQGSVAVGAIDASGAVAMSDKFKYDSGATSGDMSRNVAALYDVMKNSDTCSSGKQQNKRQKSAKRSSKNMGNIKCKLCNKIVLRQRISLIQHATVHLDLKCFKCVECDFASCHKRCTSIHMKMLHKIDSVSPLMSIEKKTYEDLVEKQIGRCFGKESEKYRRRSNL